MTDHPLGDRALAQIAIVVHDLEKAVAVYSRLLGVAPPPILISGEYADAHTSYRGQPSPARVRMAFFNLGPVSLELMQPVDEPSAWKDVLDARGEGLHHIAFRVEDTDAALAYLDAQGMAMIQQGQYPGGQYTYVDSEPQLGIMLELLENFDAK